MSRKPSLPSLRRSPVNNTTICTFKNTSVQQGYFSYSMSYPINSKCLSLIQKTPISGCFRCQPIGKPGSVVDDHLSSLQIALQIERLTIAHADHISSHLLAADRVYLHCMSPYTAVSSYLTPFTLTPLLAHIYKPNNGILRSGIVSVALSLGSPPVAVSDCRILCCPDFPLAEASDHLIDCSIIIARKRSITTLIISSDSAATDKL